MYDALNRLKGFFHIADLSASNVEAALALQASDFEDAMQYFSARDVQADVIVTRNEKDFYFSSIKIMSPKDFLKTVLMI